MLIPFRRLSLITLFLLSAASAAHPELTIEKIPAAESFPIKLFPANTRILFQGDSITDGNRGRNTDPNHILGHGYAFLIAAKQGAAFPKDNLVFINRGISGNRVGDLLARWKADTLDQKPDVLSVLIGVNDVLKAFRQQESFDAAAYEKTYDELLKQTLTVNPKVQLMLGEPFILPGNHTKERWEDWQKAIKEAQAVVEKLAARYHCPVVHFQKVFDQAAQAGAPADYWIWDGIHPTYSGHQLMADEWMKVYRASYGGR